MTGRFNYDIHGLVTVRSDARLPELERFRIDGVLDHPTVRVALGRVGSAEGEHRPLAHPLPRVGAARVRLRDRGPRATGSTSSRRAGWRSRRTSSTPTSSSRSCAGRSSSAATRSSTAPASPSTATRYLITARTDTGKTTTILKTLDRHPHAFLSDDLTLVCPDGRVLTYPKPLTISRHTVRGGQDAAAEPTRERADAARPEPAALAAPGGAFAMLIARTDLPAATINAFIQCARPAAEVRRRPARARRRDRARGAAHRHGDHPARRLGPGRCSPPTRRCGSSGELRGRLRLPALSAGSRTSCTAATASGCARRSGTSSTARWRAGRRPSCAARRWTGTPGCRSSSSARPAGCARRPPRRRPPCAAPNRTTAPPPCGASPARAHHPQRRYQDDDRVEQHPRLPQPARPPAAPCRDGGARRVPAGCLRRGLLRLRRTAQALSLPHRRRCGRRDGQLGHRPHAHDRHREAGASVPSHAPRTARRPRARRSPSAPRRSTSGRRAWASRAAPRFCYRVYGGAIDLLGTDRLAAGRASRSRRARPTPFSLRRPGRLGPGQGGGQPAAGRRHGRRRGQRRALRGHAPATSATRRAARRTTATSSRRATTSAASSGRSPGRRPARRSRCSRPTGNHGLSDTFLTMWPSTLTAAGSSGRLEDGHVLLHERHVARRATRAPGTRSTRATRASTSSTRSWAGWQHRDRHELPERLRQPLDAEQPGVPVAGARPRHPSRRSVRIAFFHYPLYVDNSTEPSDTFLQGPEQPRGAAATATASRWPSTATRTSTSATAAPPAAWCAYVTAAAAARPEPVNHCSRSTRTRSAGRSSSAKGVGLRRGGQADVEPSQVHHFLLVTVNGAR